jgi:Na+/melibiose symporter-like transporter
MANAYTRLKKPLFLIFSGLTLLSPLTLFLFTIQQFIGVLAFALLSGAALLGFVYFLEFKLTMDINDSGELNEENRVKFDEVVNKETKNRLLFVNIYIGVVFATLTFAVVMHNLLILLAFIAAAVLLFLFFQNQIGSQNIPVLKKKYLEDNIEENLGVIRKKTVDDEDE